MHSLHRQELRRQELVSEFGSNLRNRKTPSNYPQINSNSRTSYQIPTTVQEVVKKVKTCHISQRYRPIAGTCLTRKTVAKGRRNQEESHDPVREETGFHDEDMGLPMKARSRMMSRKCIPRNMFESNPLLRVSDSLIGDDMMRLTDEELDDEESDEAATCTTRSFLPKTTSGQRMKFGLAVLMIPSLIVIMNGHKKFNSSNSNVDYSGMAGGGGGGAGLGAMGGMGGHGMGGHGMGGFGRGGGGAPGIPGMGMDDDPLDALGYPGTRKGGRNRKGKKGKKSRKTPFDPFEDSLEGKMKQMMGGIPGIDAQEQLDKIQQLQEQYQKGKNGMLGKGYLDSDADDDYEGGAEDDDEGVSVHADGAEVDLAKGSEYMEPFVPMGLDYPNEFIDIPKRSKSREGNPDPGLNSEVVDEVAATPPEEELSSKLAAADVPTLKAIGYKVVLVWSDDVKLSDIPLGINSFTDHECEYARCVVTRNKSHEFLSDSIIVTPNDVNLPTNRATEQTWILYHSKPGAIFSQEMSSVLVNLTWSFASNSNITVNNAKREEISKESFSLLPAEHLIFFKTQKLMEIWARKKKESKVVLFWSESCEDPSHPLLKLFHSNSIGVETVRTCPGSSVCSLIMDEQDDVPFHMSMTDQDCFKKLLQDSYLFSLIEDHSTLKCSNYTTRKLLTALESSAIPIAYVNSQNVVPENAILNLNTISNVELITRMNNVIKDFSQFKSYFEWKKRYRITTNRNDLCQLCSYLYRETQATGFTIGQWLEESKQCND